MKSKLTITTVVLAIFTPASFFVFLYIYDLFEFLRDAVIEKIVLYRLVRTGVTPDIHRYGLDDKTLYIMGGAFFVLCYAALFWQFRKMYTQMKEGKISRRTFDYTALLVALPFFVVFIFIVGSLMGIGEE